MKLYIRTELNRYVRRLVVEGAEGRAEFYGDPVKAVATLTIFSNSEVKGWIKGKGVEVEAPPEAWQALKALCSASLTWKRAAEYGFLRKPTPQNILRTLSIEAVLK